MPLVPVCDSKDAVVARAAERLTARIDAAIAARDAAFVRLTGGDTAARRLYEALGDDRRPWRTQIDWRRLHRC